MAYTLEELATWWHSQPAGNWNASGTLVRTQDNGITGFMQVTVTDVGTRANFELKASGLEQFSDRTIDLIQTLPDGLKIGYPQNFDARYIDPVFQKDAASLEIRRLGGVRYELIITFARWGGIPPFEIDLLAGTKLYTGIGQAIGNASPQALYVLSIQTVGPVIIT